MKATHWKCCAHFVPLGEPCDRCGHTIPEIDTCDCGAEKYAASERCPECEHRRLAGCTCVPDLDANCPVHGQKLRPNPGVDLARFADEHDEG